MKKCMAFIFVACLVLSAGNAYAVSAMVSLSSLPVGGYGDSGYSNWTAAVDSAFGSNVTTLTDFGGSSLTGYDAVILNVRFPFYRLTSDEAGKLSNYIASGGRVLMVGDNSYFNDWNGDILGVVGGTYNSTEFTGITPTVTVNELVDGVAAFTSNTEPRPRAARRFSASGLRTCGGAATC